MNQQVERPFKRMTLRELMTHAEKCSRDLIEACQAGLMSGTSEVRDLSRPVRRRSHYPTLLALRNAIRKLETASEEAMVLATYLLEQLEEIRENAQQEYRRRP